MFEDRGIIPKCLMAYTAKQYIFINKKKFDQRYCPKSLQNVHEDVYHLSKFKYPFALQECLSLNGAQQQYENTNASQKELKLTKTFSNSFLWKSQNQAV